MLLLYKSDTKSGYIILGTADYFFDSKYVLDNRTFSLLYILFIISPSNISLPHLVNIIRVLLQNFSGFRFRNNIIGTPTLTFNRYDSKDDSL